MIIFSPCAICERCIVDGDVVVRIEEGDRRGWVHATCTKEGLKRWLRKGRPYGDPLAWERAEKPVWRPDASDGRAWAHIHQEEGTLMPDERRVRSP